MRFVTSEMELENGEKSISALLTDMSEQEAQKWMAGADEVVTGSQEIIFQGSEQEIEKLEKTLEALMGLDDLNDVELPVQRLLEAIFMLGFQAGRLHLQTSNVNP